MDDRSEGSLEELIEREDLGLEILHPGGLTLTEETASRCRIGRGTRVLEVACGTGESACFLAGDRGADVTAVDHSAGMVRRTRRKARERGVEVAVVRADAHRLPFPRGGFDAAISECALSLLDKERALSEMVRVVRPGGYVGFHEIFWKETAPEGIKAELEALEGERPETLEGWKALLDDLEVDEVVALDRSDVMPEWMKESHRQMGLGGLLRAGIEAWRAWGLRGLWRVLRSERIFASRHLGYGIVVGRRA